MTDKNMPPAGTTSTSVFHSDLSLEAKLERARLELLDLSARNRLLNMPRSGRAVRSIDIVDERAAEVYRLLVKENRAFTFNPGRSAKASPSVEGKSDADEIEDLAQPEDDTMNDRGVLRRHADTKLQTRLTSAGLQRRLLDLYSDARTLEEEQGVNILFLTLGSLKWVDPTNKENVRYAPLILIPVSLERGSAAERFKLKLRQEDIASNLSLEAFLDRVHSLRLPAFEPGEEFDPEAYLANVANAISSKPDWEVLRDDLVLGFFSFAKFLMYRDLDPEVWPVDGKLTTLPMIRCLLAEGFPHPGDMAPEDSMIDPLISPAELRHVVDADSSQALAIHDVRCGRNLVIQGPPGTGKSQTIANVIAAAIYEGKSVLFVAEKMAALEVVKRRLDQAGVGDACLELHSNKANKRMVLEELRRTWELGSPRGALSNSLHSKLQEARDELNGHAQRMHDAHVPSGLTPYQVMGELVRLRDGGQTPTSLQLQEPVRWSSDERLERERLLKELIQRVQVIGLPTQHPWRGVGLETILPAQVDRIVTRIGDLKERLAQILSEQSELAAILETPPPIHLRTFEATAARARRVGSAPADFQECLGASEWVERQQEITSLLVAGRRYVFGAETLSGKLRSGAWNTDVRAAHKITASLSPSFDSDAFRRVRQICELLPGVSEAAARLRNSLGIEEAIDRISSIKRVLAIGTHVAAAPTVSPDAFLAAVWDHSVEQAGDLVEAVGALEAAREQVGNHLNDGAWEMDCGPVRQALASHGTSVFRFLSGDWRKANRVVKSLLRSPELPAEEVIPLLDAVIRGQRCLRLIQQGEALGRSAFGSRWRGDRSNAAELRALLEWMRSLGPFSTEIRTVASRTNDQAAIGEAVTALNAILGKWEPLLEAARRDLSEPDFETLATIWRRCAEVANSDAQTKQVLTDAPESAGARLPLLEGLLDWQSAESAITTGHDLGTACFGPVWSGTTSPWAQLERCAEWVSAHMDVRNLAAHIEERVEIARRATAAEAATESLVRDADSLFFDLRLDTAGVFAEAQVPAMPVERLRGQFESWLAHPEQLSQWVAYRERAQRGRALGLQSLIDRLEDGSIAPERAVTTFRQAYFEAILEAQVVQVPELGKFDGHLHRRLIHEFIELDRQRIEAARLEVVRAHHRRIPQGGGGVGPLGILRAEIAKRRGHMPIRQLMMKAAAAIQALKPVVMMSPLSVAQFLPPGQLTFDLLVMDEASQIQPVDALGAIARCRQVVVVGDERQLPPTKFFSKMTSGQSEEDDADSAQVADIESILGLFTARGMPQRMLRWHYRSRHQSLIAVSNAQFYENKLFIVPSPYTSAAGRGLRFHHVTDGRFDSGNTRTNAIEAQVVADAVIRHAREHPERSLGVATFSTSQRRAIRDHIELLRRANPDTEGFFHSHPGEPFFVKNLENVQGDERDVILISVGYGRNAQGYMAMAFGPLSAEGGERRLNVLISRAKLRCEVFASITDEDIDTERGKGKGVFAFKLFLHFARTGRLAMAETTGRDHDSVFEAQVANALQARGVEVHRQVGIAGFFIDLAIGDPDRPGRYLLGIECDGASYHSARSTRDRDRLRQAVLEDHGWIIHRVWSTDWFQRPKEQLELVMAALEAAKQELEGRGENQASKSRAVGLEVVTIDREGVTQVGLSEAAQSAGSGSHYVEVSLRRPDGWPELHETPTGAIAQLVEEVVKIEGPVHLDEVTARIRSAWDLQRSGPRIQSLVERAAAHAELTGKVEVREKFLSSPGGTVRIRDRSAVNSVNLRKPEMLPPIEVEEAVLQVLQANFGCSDGEISQAVGRLFGFRATSAQFREVVQTAVHALTQRSLLVRKGPYLVVNQSTGSD